MPPAKKKQKKDHPQPGKPTTEKPLSEKKSQEALLAEAVATESENQRWLEIQRRAARDAHVTKVKTERSRALASRRLSRRGCYVTITFPEIDKMPEILRNPKGPPVPKRQISVRRHLRTNTAADAPLQVPSELDLPFVSPILN